MKGRRIQWRFGGQMLGWGAALATGALLLAWADWQRMARTHFADIALLLVAALFLGLGLWLGFSVWNKPQQPPGNPAAVASPRVRWRCWGCWRPARPTRRLLGRWASPPTR